MSCDRTKENKRISWHGGWRGKEKKREERKAREIAAWSASNKERRMKNKSGGCVHQYTHTHTEEEEKRKY